MRYQTFSRFISAAALSLAVAACGGGGAAALINLATGGIGGSGITLAGGGIGGTGISLGAITGFGSIFVNGVEFSTSTVVISRDGVTQPACVPSSGNSCGLKVGMQIEVQGTIDSATAGSALGLTVKEAVRGTVEAAPTGNQATGATMTVLGQTVRINNFTVIDSNVPNFAALAGGMLVEVHGPRDDTGAIVATFIEQKSAPVTHLVRGTVTAHNAVAQTFTVGSLTVNYGGASFTNMPAPSGSNWVGLAVEAKGSSCAGSPVCGTLTATQVSPDGLAKTDALNAEVEGFVTSFTSLASFKVGTQSVTTTGSTVYLGGLSADLVAGTAVEVEGSLAGGLLTATKVIFRDNVQIDANVTAVTADTITLEGLGTPGIAVTVDNAARFRSTTASAGNLNPLLNKSIRIRGRATGPAAVLATIVQERGAPDRDFILQGFVSPGGATDPLFTILGLTVDTSALNSSATTGDFKGPDEITVIGRAAFFSALTPNGGLARAKGRVGNGALGGPAFNAFDSSTLREVDLEK